jgi:hypothetical protein
MVTDETPRRPEASYAWNAGRIPVLVLILVEYPHFVVFIHAVSILPYAKTSVTVLLSKITVCRKYVQMCNTFAHVFSGLLARSSGRPDGCDYNLSSCSLCPPGGFFQSW